MRLVKYSLLRLLLLAAALGLGYLLGLRGWLLAVLATVIAALASYALLAGSRDAAAAQLAEGASRRRPRSSVDDDAVHEDAAVDAAAAEDAAARAAADAHAAGEAAVREGPRPADPER